MSESKEHDRIWLQTFSDPCSEWNGEVTWCQDKIHDDDVGYVNAKLYAELEQQRDELLAALESALEIVTTDRCDGESFFAHGVNAACERHAAGIRNLIDKVKK